MMVFSTGLSAAHTKLCLRDVVTDHDAAMAILLYEESITSRTGKELKAGVLKMMG